ncbi:hypothetical protein CLUG_00659 [Clavispora lusitaniae ATCC 42720]|uniref:S1 motif domain-containing protein n=1 Tax=Clavispora lusitaniae (strain ATCC 42720) TaxID=306902 RepID=C4XXI6_CLAL4|nr:uncharacterized protein CLUG_00659 [Clavispora lusitaniae ATCC 42720]EEQ36536.1 hypothetical protein CLUG_00659 [Clavispora lusitaniae ATCC 42720]
MDSSSKSVLNSSEVAFPRGGGSVLTPLEMKTISNKATEDVLFEQAQASKRSGGSTSHPAKKRKKQSKTAVSKTETEEKGISVDHMTLKNLIPGCEVLGQIVRVDKMDLVLAITDNLVGRVPITAIGAEVSAMLEKYEAAMDSSDEEDDEPTQSFAPEFPKLASLFEPGQWLRAIVTPTPEGQRGLHLSIAPSDVNASMESDDFTPGNIVQASVKSIEDHGVVLNLGVGKLSGFLSKKELKKADIPLSSFTVGKVILTSVASADARTVSLRPAEKENVSKKTVVTTISSIDAVHPGTLVNAIIAELSDDGVAARLFGMVDASFTLPHVEEYALEKLKNSFGIGSTVRARIIGTLLQNGTKKFILSRATAPLALQPELDSSALEAFPVGFIFDSGIEVVGADSDFIYLSTGSHMAQVHKSQVDPELDPNMNYPVGSKHNARVLGYNRIDNLLVVTLNPKLIASKFVSADDVPVGEYIPAVEIIKILDEAKGMIVKIFGDFEALVPANHMSDIKLVYPERKFKVGGKVKGRVLYKNGKKLFVTLRKSLVNMEDDAIVSDIENVVVGFKTTAIVDRFVPGGALVTFFGKLRAYLPKSEISETFVEEAKDYLKLGQAVTVRILSVNAEENKISVTLRQSTELSNKQIEHLESISIGRTLVEANIVEKTKEAVIIELEGSNLRGVISTNHLSDGNYEENRIIYKNLEIGGSIEVLVLEKDIRARTVIASAKKSLITAARTETLPVHYEDIHVGSMVPGYIKSVTNLGLFVSFGGRLTGLVLAKNATNDPTEDLSSKFYKNQSVVCDVIKTDDDNKRFLLSLTSSDSAGAFESSKLSNPVDAQMKSKTDYAVGVSTFGVIDSIEPGYLKIRLADNLEGRVEANQCIRSWKSIKDPKNPLASFTVGEKVPVKVLGTYDYKWHSFTTAAAFKKTTVLSLTTAKDQLKSKSPYKPDQLSDITVGSEYVVYIERFHNGTAKVSLTPSIKGEISVYNLSDDMSKYSKFDESFPLGTALKANVIGIDFEHGMVKLSARKQNLTSFTQLKVGDQYPAKVFKVTKSFVLVELAPGLVGYSYITDALDDYDLKLEETYHINQPVAVTITETLENEGKFSVSLRNEKTAKDKPVNSISELHRGDVVKGFIKAINNAGLYVSLGRDLFALVPVSNISDAFLVDWKKFFKPFQSIVGKIVQCKVEGRITMTLKESELNGHLADYKTFDELEIGEIYDGTVKKVADYGVFVKLDGTAVDGLCHRSEIADNQVENAAALFAEGDRVKVKILKIFKDKKQLSLGMKASYFTEADENSDDVEMAEASDDDDEEEVNSEDEVMAEGFSDNDQSSDSEDEEEESAKEGTDAAPTGLSGLSTNGFDWTASILDQAEDNESSSDEDEDFTESHKKRKRKGKKNVEDKTSEINARAPESVQDFERMIIGNPDSSVLWMNYMSFQLQLGEIDKSREIAERALKTINYREEQEKMNIWIAILNLENTFGSEESLDAAFKRAVQHMDSLTMHQKLIGIYQLSEKFDKADELYRVMTKKFAKNVNVWVSFGSSLMDRKLFDDAHELLARALQSLPKSSHIDVVRKFAQLEFAKGDPEQGRSLFEGLVTDAPKRIDLWNVYIDQEIKQGDREKIVSLFERVVTKKLSRKQAKFFFSKWLGYEEEHGSEQSASRVKALAVEYVQSQSKDEE